jgi:hypothetical protein
MWKERTYRSLKKVWVGFKIAKKDSDHDKMKYYVEGIQKFERQLHLPVSDFSDILKGDARNGIGGKQQNRRKIVVQQTMRRNSHYRKRKNSKLSKENTYHKVMSQARVPT